MLHPAGGAAAQPDQSEPQETTLHQPMSSAMKCEDTEPRGNGRRGPGKVGL